MDTLQDRFSTLLGHKDMSWLDKAMVYWSGSYRYGPLESWKFEDGNLVLTMEWYVEYTTMDPPDVSPAQFDDDKRTIPISSDAVLLQSRDGHIQVVDVTTPESVRTIHCDVSQHDGWEFKALRERYWPSYLKDFCHNRLSRQEGQWLLTSEQSGKAPQTVVLERATISEDILHLQGTGGMKLDLNQQELRFLSRKDGVFTAVFKAGKKVSFSDNPDYVPPKHDDWD